LGAKNFNVYPYNYSGTQTFGGAVTTVFGDDGRITLNGTAGANDNIIIHSRANYSSLVDKNPIILQKGTYKISRSTTGYDLRVVNTVNGSGNLLATLNGDSKEATFTLNDTSQVGIIIDITSGDEFSNKVIDPMISFDGGEFVPYAMTNKELTASAADQKTAINAIITAATGAADFAAFKTAMGAITPVTRSLSKEASTEDVPEEVIEEEKPVTKKTTKKTVKEGE
jgi:hypothetical protein